MIRKLLHVLFCFSLLSSLASAWASTPEMQGPHPILQTDAPKKQPGIPAKSFEFNLILTNLNEPTKGEVTFEALSFGESDPQGIIIPPVKFTYQPPQAYISVKPIFKKDGWYWIKATVKADNFTYQDYRVNLLYLNGLVYYAGSGISVIDAITNNSLTENIEFQKIEEKRQASINSKKSKPINSSEDGLSKSDSEKWSEIYNQERENISNEIKQRLKSRSKNQSKSSSELPQKGDLITVKIRWPSNNQYTSFLPLQGAKIEIINIDAIGFLSNGVFANGVLDSNGEFKFTSPVNSLNYRVKIKGEYNNFKVTVFNKLNNKDEDLIATYDGISLIDIKPKDGEDGGMENSWSVFQAMYDLSNGATSYGLSKAPTFNTVRTNAVRNNSDVDFAYYSHQMLEMVIGGGNFFDWDVIGHEFAHAVAYQNNMISQAPGGAHNGSNQYDYNPTLPAGTAPLETYHNKAKSNHLAMSEGFATWYSIAHWKTSKYASLVPNVGDDKYQDISSLGSTTVFDMEKNDAVFGTTKNIFGEDGEFSIAKFLWDIYDNNQTPEVNVRGPCDLCFDVVSQNMKSIIVGAMIGKNIDSISTFYTNFFQSYVGKSIGGLDTIGPVDAVAVKKMKDIGVLAAEFGFAPNIGYADNINAFEYADYPAGRDWGTNPIKLIWQQRKTGEMPGLDKFEILIYSESFGNLLFKTNVLQIAPVNGKYTYTFTQDEIKNLVQRLFSLADKTEHRLNVVIKGVASGVGVVSGGVATGPYYGNSQSFGVTRTVKNPANPIPIGYSAYTGYGLRNYNIFDKPQPNPANLFSSMEAICNRILNDFSNDSLIKPYFNVVLEKIKPPTWHYSNGECQLQRYSKTNGQPFSDWGGPVKNIFKFGTVYNCAPGDMLNGSVYNFYVELPIPICSSGAAKSGAYQPIIEEINNNQEEYEEELME